MSVAIGRVGVFGIAGNDGLVIGLAAVNDDAIWAPMTFQCLAKEAFGCWQITVCAEEELDRVAEAVDGAVEIHPLAADFDVGLVHMPLAGNAPLVPVKALQQLRREVDDPTMDGGVIDVQATLGHHLFQVA